MGIAPITKHLGGTLVERNLSSAVCPQDFYGFAAGFNHAGQTPGQLGVPLTNPLRALIHSDYLDLLLA